MIRKAELTLKIEDKDYTKQELIEEVQKELKKLDEGIYRYTACDFDDFYSKYNFQKVQE